MARPKKKTEAQIATERRVADLEAVSLPADAAGLVMQEPIAVTRAGEKGPEGKKVAHDTARRHDAFEALKKGLAQGAYDAARRFEMDLLNRLGLSERMAGTGRVDCTAGHTTDLSMTSGIMVDKVKERISPRDFWLLSELIAPAIDRGTWRQHVAYVTGEEHTEGQAACVRAVSVNLRDVYTAIEREGAAQRLAKAFERRVAA